MFLPAVCCISHQDKEAGLYQLLTLFGGGKEESALVTVFSSAVILCLLIQAELESSSIQAILLFLSGSNISLFSSCFEGQASF